MSGFQTCRAKKTDFIQLAKGKLNDPILVEWALDRYWGAEKGDLRLREAMEQAWFDDLTLRRWLDSDDQDILTGLFSQLPAERFANLWSGDRRAIGPLAWESLPAFENGCDRAFVLAMTETLNAKGLTKLAKHWDTVADFLIGSIAAACDHKDLDTFRMSLGGGRTAVSRP